MFQRQHIVLAAAGLAAATITAGAAMAFGSGGQAPAETSPGGQLQISTSSAATTSVPAVGAASSSVAVVVELTTAAEATTQAPQLGGLADEPVPTTSQVASSPTDSPLPAETPKPPMGTPEPPTNAPHCLGPEDPTPGCIRP